MRILVVDDQVLFREALVMLIDSQPDMTVVGEAGSVEEAIAKASDLQPDVVLMDFGLSDGTGVDATSEILAGNPRGVVIFLTVHEDDEHLFAALRCGAKGYLSKNTPAAMLLAQLRGAQRGEPALPAAMTGRVLEEFARLDSRASHATDLTHREAEVLAALASGATNREIAEQLVVSENTIKNHVSKILAKLGVPNRRQAARFTNRVGR